jgi:hypothetical protein
VSRREQQAQTIGMPQAKQTGFASVAGVGAEGVEGGEQRV